MKKSIKTKMAKALGNSTDINKKAIVMKSAWDEVEHLLKSEKHNSKNK